MKRTLLRKIGKRGREWIVARAKLKVEYEQRGIVQCEIRLPGCWKDNALGLAHRHKRDWYYKHGGLGDFKQTVLACNICHDKIEHNQKLTEEIFLKLRGNE